MNCKIPLFEIYWDGDGVEAVTDSISAEMNWAAGPNMGNFGGVDPWGHRFDPKNQGVGQMKNTVLKHSGPGMLEMFWHSNRIIFKGVDVLWVYMRRFEGILKFLAGSGAEFVTMGEVGDDIGGRGV